MSALQGRSPGWQSYVPAVVKTSHYDGRMVDRISGVPAYQQVAADLRQKIDGGHLAPGAQLPSERAMMTTYGVSRPTIREAVSLLRAQGIVIAQQGKGVFVRPARTMRRLAGRRLSRAARSANAGAFFGEADTPSVRTEVRFEPADAGTAQLLGIAEGDEVCVRDRVMFADEHPVQLAVSWLPRELSTGTAIEQSDTGSGGIYARLEDAGHVLERFEETVSARMPSRDERISLQLDEGIPVIVVVRVAHSTSRPLEVNRMTLAADRYELHYEIPAD